MQEIREALKKRKQSLPQNAAKLTIKPPEKRLLSAELVLKLRRMLYEMSE